MATFRQYLGTLLYDWPRFLAATAGPGRWIRMRNRNDKLSFCPDQSGVRCDWIHTRPLHLCTVFPLTARWLLRRALQSRPVQMKDRPESVSGSLVCRNGAPVGDDSPVVSFLIGHRGPGRLPLLLATLRSIAGQEELPFECIVVEQDENPVVRDDLPGWVRHLHSPGSERNLLYNRSRAYNEGARIARGDLLVLHDNDMPSPSDYGAEALRVHRLGYDVCQLKRCIFYLDAFSTEQFCRRAEIPRDVGCQNVLENATGGGSLVISARAYQEIGGMDEQFVGWGGEDEEFWDRCLTRKVWEFGCLPFIHLWHEAQPGKRAANGQGAHTAELTKLRRAIPPAQRIAELIARREGASQ